MPGDKKKKKKKNLVKDIQIDEVSFCGRGMNPGAHVALFKSYDPEITKATFEEVLEGMQLSEEVMEIVSHAYDMSHALSRSLESIMMDEDVTDKKAAIQESLNSFVSHLKDMAENSAVAKAVNPIQWISDHPEEDLSELISLITTTLSKEENMSEELKKKLEKLEKQNAQLTKDLKLATALAGMTDDQKAFWKSLSGEDKDSFLEKSGEDRDAMISKSREGDEEIVVAGVPVRKSEVGDTQFAIFKAQQIENDELRKKNEKAEQIRKAQEYQTRVEKEYPNLPGDVVVKGKMLQALDGMDEKYRQPALDMLKAADKAMTGAFRENGHGHEGGGDDPTDKLDSLAKAHADKHSVTFAQAYDAVLKTPEGAQLYQESMNPTKH